MSDNVDRGLLVINTGDGKGKSTAAFGMLLRAWGHGLRVSVIQFIKNENDLRGEQKAARRLGIEWSVCGSGFVHPHSASERAAAHARAGWRQAQEIIAGQSCDLLVLDEFTYPLNFGWVNSGEALEWLDAHRPPGMHIVVTGRAAPTEWVEYADLVTEMNVVKHPYKSGAPAQMGIEF